MRSAEHRLEAMSVSQYLPRQRRDDLAESHVGLRERLGAPVGPEEDRADDGALRLNRHDDDRPDVPRIEIVADAFERRIGDRVRNEDRLARLERALELGISLEVDDEISHRRIAVRRDESHLVRAAREVDGAPLEPEGVAERARDDLEDLCEVRRRRDFLQNVDDRDEVVALALELCYPRAKASDLVIAPTGLRSRRCVVLLGWGELRLWIALVHLPPHGAR